MVTDLPAMPEVRARQGRDGLLTPADGRGLAIGWQFRSGADGGPAFVIVRRSRAGFQKVVEAFPPTAEGWAAAWQALSARYPQGIEPALAALRLRASGPAAPDREVRAKAPGDREASGGIGCLVVLMAGLAVGGLVMVWSAAHSLAGGHVRQAGFASSYDAVLLLVVGVVVMAFGVLAVWAIARSSAGGRPVFDAETNPAQARLAGTGSGMVTVRSGARTQPIVLVSVLALLAPEPVFSRPRWAEHLPASAVAGYLVAVAVVVILVCVRAVLMGVRFEEQRITVRNFRTTHRIGWKDVDCLTDGSVLNSRRELEWALKVVLRDGGSVTATGAKGLRAAGRETIRQAAARYGIPASITGKATEPSSHSGG